MNHCRICHKQLSPFMSFGKMPIANGFLTQQDFAKEQFFELAPAFCNNCQMLQIIEQPAPEAMFHENYAFFSQTSAHMTKHFATLANQIQTDYLSTTRNPFIVELGSNDGILLQHFAKANIRHLGIEPSANVAKVAQQHGVNTLTTFFTTKVAEQILNTYGAADIITASNVMCHLPNLLDIAEGIALLLKPTGYLIFEDPYLGDVIEKTSYDQIYDEHVFLFSVNSVANTFSKVGLEIIDAICQPTHGGSMRYILATKGKNPIHHRVTSQLHYEETLKLQEINTYLNFKKNCEHSKEQLLSLLDNLIAENHKVVGYAATSKSTTVINYCNITTKHLQYICDTTPIKQGKFSPGAHIPITAYETFANNYPDYAVLFAWNHAKEIFAKEQNYNQQGGKWLTFVPNVKIL